MSRVEKIFAKYQRRLKEEKDKRATYNRTQKKRDDDVPEYGKTAGNVERELEMELTAFLMQWVEEKTQKSEKKREQEEEESDEEHSSLNGALSAILWRNSGYNQNCYDYLSKNDERRKIFEMKDTKNRLEKSFSFDAYVKHFMQHFGFSQRNENFSPNAKLSEETRKKNLKGTKAGNDHPYVWRGHHMIPCGAFYQGQKNNNMTKNIFTDDQYALLLMSDYDVNRGQNIIFLPRNKAFFQPIHDMLLHPSGHNRYTNMVQKKMKVVSKKLRKLARKGAHPSGSVKMAEKLAEIEDEFWQSFVDWGIEEVDARVQRREPDERDFIQNGALV